MAIDLKTWLRRAPTPVAVLADGQRIEVPKSPRCWSELVETLGTINPTRIACLDAQGGTIRAKTFDDDSPAPASTESSELQTFAKLLAQAYSNGADAQAKAYSAIFEENTKLVRLLADRLGALELAWQKSLQVHARMVTDLAEAHAAAATQEEDGGVLNALAAGMMQAQAQPPPNGKGKRP
jgi:hypothetical protein